MKKKVLFVISTLRIGGAEKSLITLLKNLDPNRIDISLLVFEDGGILQKEVPGYVEILPPDKIRRAMTLEFRYYFKDLVFSLHWAAALSRFWMMIRPRLFHKKMFNWEKASKYIAPLKEHYDVAIGYLEDYSDYYVIDKVNADKKIGWIHSDLSKQIPLPEALQYYSCFDSLVTISNVCAVSLHNLLPTQEVTVIENIVMKDYILEQSKEHVDWDENTIHIITVGRIELVKGIDFAFEAARILRRQGISFMWHVYGTGSMSEDLEEAIKEQSMEDYFILEGQTTNPYPYMRRADILVQPSRWEGKSIVLDEAKILGKAIVVTNYPSVTDQIEDRVTGLIADIDPVSIAEKIVALIKDPNLKRILEYNCEIEENYSMETVDLLYKLIGC